MSEADEDEEVVITTATYKQATISTTNFGSYFITINGVSYPVADLQDAKNRIDRLRDDQRN